MEYDTLFEQILSKAYKHDYVHSVLMGIRSDDGSIDWKGALGTGNSVAVSTEDPFFIASVTKLFIGTATMMLSEKGLIDLNKPASYYLGNLMKGVHIYRGDDYSDAITVRHLLTHTSGIADWLEDRPTKGKALLDDLAEGSDREITLPEICEYVKENLKPHFPPQKLNRKSYKNRYSDTGFQLLMGIQEKVTGEKIEKWYAEHLYNPAGLTNTIHTGFETREYAEHRIPFYAGKEPFINEKALNSARDLFSTLDDQIRFMQHLMKGNFYNDSNTLKEQLGSAQRFGFPTDLSSLRLPGWPIAYGLGMMHLDMPRLFTGFRKMPVILGHTGVSGTWLFYCPDLKVTLCGSVNNISGARLPFEIVPNILLGMSNQSWHESSIR